MADLLKPLGLAALLALASPALAQDTGGDAAPAADDAAAAPAADAAPADGQPQAYIDEVFNDWSRECVRRPEGSEGDDLCWVTQVLKDDNGRPFGKFSIRRVPAGSQAVAQADVAVSMELVPYLPTGVTLGVDKGARARIPVPVLLAGDRLPRAAQPERGRYRGVQGRHRAEHGLRHRRQADRACHHQLADLAPGLHRGLGQREGAGSTGGAVSRAAPYREKT
ncbi:MAG: invasion associated locus B family protein [Paracoccaceae bacterium]